MSKKKKKVLTTVEQVGDTSGFSDELVSLNSKRKGTVIVGILGIIALVAVIIFMLVTPKSVTFIYNDLNTKQESFPIDMKTGLLQETPDKPSKEYFTFDGWFLNSDLTNPQAGITQSNLKKYKFSKISNTTLYAKWTPIVYTITYDIVGNASSAISKTVTNKNITSYTINHTPTQAEINDYVAELQKSNPDKYAKAPNASQLILTEIGKYTEDCQTSTYNLLALTTTSNKYEFVGWKLDEESTEYVTSISKSTPSNITLHAVWKVK